MRLTQLSRLGNDLRLSPRPTSTLIAVNYTSPQWLVPAGDGLLSHRYATAPRGAHLRIGMSRVRRRA